MQIVKPITNELQHSKSNKMVCAKQRCRSAFTSTESDQLGCSMGSQGRSSDAQNNQADLSDIVCWMHTAL